MLRLKHASPYLNTNLNASKGCPSPFHSHMTKQYITLLTYICNNLTGIASQFAMQGLFVEASPDLMLNFI